MMMSGQTELRFEPQGEGLESLLSAHEKRAHEAIDELIRSAGSGSPISMLYLGYAYQYGRCVPVNFLIAEQWFSRALEKEFTPACLALASLLIVRRRYEEAHAVLNAAAATNFAPAIRRLGLLYFNGLGVEKNVENAKALLERAAAGGNIAAKIQAARVLKTGHFRFRQRLWGHWLGLRALWEVMCVHPKDPTSERFW